MKAVRGVGLGFRPELAADLLADPRSVDFVEVVAEACFASAALRRQAQALSEVWPVVPHGVKLSLGSAEGIDPGRVGALALLAKELRAQVITEHAAFVRAGGHDVGHLTALPRTREALSVLVRNVAQARRGLPDVPLLLENVAWTVRWPQAEMGEPEFYTELSQQTGCGLLLDLGNLYANALNSGLEPRAELARFPLESVRMIHVAGGRQQGGFYFDDHAHAVAPEVFELLALALPRTGPVPILIERDAAFPAFGELRAELEQARSLQSLQPPAPVPTNFRVDTPATPRADSTLAIETLAERQAELAALLGAVETSTSTPWDETEIQRTRVILQRKRREEALPLLPNLDRHGTALTALTDRVFAQTRRAPSFAAVTDALRIAELVRQTATNTGLVRAAELDRLLLRARFSQATPEQVRRRLLPFVGRVRHPAGHGVWVIKGFGRGAPTRVVHERH